MEIEWQSERVMNAVEATMKAVSYATAKQILIDAGQILKQKAETTTEKGLLSQMDIKQSKFDKNGYIVRCQGKGNWRKPYHASFVELGTYKDEAKPFMRPAIRKNKRKANKQYRKALEKI